jgi:hypothetical protein
MGICRKIGRLMKRLFILIGLFISLTLSGQINTGVVSAQKRKASTPVESLKENQATYASGTFAALRYTSRYYQGTAFTSTGTYYLTKIEVSLAKVASPTMNITCYLYSSSSYNPTNLLASSTTTVDASTITDNVFRSFSFSGSYQIQNSTQYWVVLKGDNVNSTNYVTWGCATSGGDILTDEDGTGTWTNQVAWHGSYKIYGY